MREFPSLSIITPTLNQGRYIRETIESVLNQHYPNLEYMVIDGGSTDTTHDILSSYADQLSWVIEQGKGQSEAINQGWKSTHGEIIAWINSDDTYFPGTFEKATAYFKQHPEVDVLYGDCDYVDDDGRFLRSYPTREHDFSDLLRNTINYIPQPAVFFRRELLETVGFLDESLNYVMDFDYWLRAGASHQVQHLPSKFATLRLQPEAKSIANLDQFAAELVRVYTSFFAVNKNAKAFDEIKNDAMANIYFRAADCSFWGKDFAAARHYAKNSRRHKKWPPRSLWGWIFLGYPGRFIAEKILGNPYLP